MHHPKRLTLALVLWAWLLSGCQTDTPPVPAESQSARLSELAGRVEIRNPGQADYRPAEEGALLEEGGEVRTGPDGRARLDLSSGTLVRLAPNTSFVLTANHPQEGSLFTRLRLLAGQIWVALTGGSLEVETPGGTAAVRGSHLMVWIDPATGQVWVSCFEGECAAFNAGGSLDLSTGEGAILYLVGEGETPPPPQARLLTWDEFQAWANSVPEASALLPDILATLTAYPTPTAATPTPSVTPASTPTPGCALQLLSPANGAALPAAGEIIFSWSPQAGAAKYQVQFISIGGAVNSLQTDENSLRLYIESLTAAGTYSWQVSALNAQGEVICTAGAFTFTKPLTIQETPPPTPPSALLTPDPNTYFSLVEGPIGFPSEFCDQRYYKVIITDIHGVSTAWLGYQVQDSLGNPVDSGTFPLLFNNGLWSGNPVIPAYPGDTVYWWFAATDGLGNNAASEVYSYLEISMCP
ncbi:MAG: FecR domain-containing protein [Anaerolineales bacterium]